jgi:Rod binding domain-containing protein
MSAAVQPAALGRPEPGAPAARRREAAEVAQQLETVFGQLLVQNLRQSAASTPGSGLFGDGPGSDQFTQWFDAMLGERVARGGGLGIAGNLLRTWEQHGLIPREPAPAHTGGSDGLV